MQDFFVCYSVIILCDLLFHLWFSMNTSNLYVLSKYEFLSLFVPSILCFLHILSLLISAMDKMA